MIQASKVAKVLDSSKMLMFGTLVTIVYLVFQLGAMGIITRKVTDGSLELKGVDEVFVKGFVYSYWAFLAMSWGVHEVNFA